MKNLMIVCGLVLILANNVLAQCIPPPAGSIVMSYYQLCVLQEAKESQARLEQQKQLSRQTSPTGWYLMTPPYHIIEFGGVSAKNYDVNSPLSQWTLNDSFVSVIECKNNSNIFQRAEKGLSIEGDNYEKFLLSKCIASDDPRLAK